MPTRSVAAWAAPKKSVRAEAAESAQRINFIEDPSVFCGFPAVSLSNHGILHL
jgi:hypothetical protein